ncbi:integral membrane sensor signal transduction histidine kinase [Paenibacillus algicola]|uniref:histidine kinase n=1 Tax=Paenibacillus algicola TaxID=2565926 RepID=A0A4P8XJV8_9BACL|nr:HAMP domain-containing sensor histidine kinase [Paenibacillus algicola]QCT01850.1 integral membrane sensor signal transduction histidine kinase [Paenibacillus algicola]
MSEFKGVLLQLLFALMPFVMYNVYYRNLEINYSRAFIAITCCISLFLAMTFPSSAVQGIMFDIRYVIMFFGLVFGGITTGLILLAEFVAYRLYLGGIGAFNAMIIMCVTFPISVLLSAAYHRARRKQLVTLLAAVLFSFLPLIYLYFSHTDYLLTHLSFNMIVMPVQNFIGIWLIVTLFNKSVSDKELQLRYLQNEKVEAANHVAASLAHEVRNPLTTVLGFLKLIRSNAFSPDKTERFIDISIEEIHRTEQILSDYLSMSKPLSSHRQELDLITHLRSVVEVMTPYATMHKVSIQTDCPAEAVMVYGNSTEMKQLLMNFIKNAIEACMDVPHAQVLISFKSLGDRVQFEIRDNGVGMDGDQLSRLGSIYYSTKRTGTGLGLTFSYQAIRSMQGTVSVNSEPQNGTVFTISLPVA